MAPTTLVIFGATGDLARRKLLPALYNLAHDGALPQRSTSSGSRAKKGPRGLSQGVRRSDPCVLPGGRPKQDVLRARFEHVKYVPGVFDDDTVYSELEKVLDGFEKKKRENCSTAPSTCRRRRSSSR